MKIRFTDFWPGFDELDNFFLDMIRMSGITPKVTGDPLMYVDLEIVSVFPDLSFARRKSNSVLRKVGLNQKRKFAKASQFRFADRVVWYTGERIEVPENSGFDGFLSYQPDALTLRNAYLPVWYLNLGLFRPRWNSRVGVFSHVDDLMRPRSLQNLTKKNACAFIGNNEPERLKVIETLQKYIQIDVYGKVTGKPIREKLEIAKNYRYTISFENEVYPGYVTEKLIEAYLSETVPLYRGNLSGEMSINHSCFFNLMDYRDLEEFVFQILESNLVNFEEIYSEPFLRNIPNFYLIQNLLLGYPN